MKQLLCLLLGVFLVQATVAQETNECDLAVGHPSDPNRVGPGKSSSEVVTHVAIPACRKAVDANPDNPRFHYQLGRALTYWADANNANNSEGMKHLEKSAKLKYPQAMFVVGLLYKRNKEFCAAEPLTKAAADMGLKSARISYVSDVLAKHYDSCGISASKEEMQDYLSQAQQQVNGYYENMLLANLKRELNNRD